jgi:hypothetical protein
MGKRTINATELVNDVRSGMSDTALIEKYKLSARGLESVFAKLVEAGLIEQSDLDARMDMSQRTVALDVYRCPACDMAQYFKFDICPQCGVIVSKFQAKAAEAASKEQVLPQTRVGAFTLTPSKDGKSLTVDGLNRQLQKKIVDALIAALPRMGART